MHLGGKLGEVLESAVEVLIGLGRVRWVAWDNVQMMFLGSEMFSGG